MESFDERSAEISQLQSLQNPVITVDPATLNQTVVFAGDSKLSTKGWADGNTSVIADKLFNEMKLDILRVPLYAMRDASDPFYDKLVSTMEAAKNAHPNVKFFASVANGDGDQNNNLHQGDKFPVSMKGCCPYNIYSLNLTAYAQKWDEYLLMLEDHNLTVDWVGPFNEDNASSTDYDKVFNQMDELGSKTRVGMETWGLQGGIDKVTNLQGSMDIVGCHFYDDGTLTDWDGKWAELVNKTSKPVWFSEATRYKTNDNINNLVAGMAHVFPSMRSGVESVAFYQAVPRFVNYDGTIQPKKYTGFKNLVNNARSKHVVPSTSSSSDMSVLAFAKDKSLSLHIVNESTSDQTTQISLQSTYSVAGTVTRTIWTANDTEVSNSYTLNGNSNWNVTVPAGSYVHLDIPLATDAGN
ncbi:hypothetical protein [Echinicola strongylocentroti]|nr:hypothetical protein [Echinicola strongylocentroti]